MTFKLLEPDAGVNTPLRWKMSIYTVRQFPASLHIQTYFFAQFFSLSENI